MLFQTYALVTIFVAPMLWVVTWEQLWHRLIGASAFLILTFIAARWQHHRIVRRAAEEGYDQGADETARGIIQDAQAAVHRAAYGGAASERLR
jgi:hypothetical protein